MSLRKPTDSEIREAAPVRPSHQDIKHSIETEGKRQNPTAAVGQMGEAGPSFPRRQSIPCAGILVLEVGETTPVVRLRRGCARRMSSAEVTPDFRGGVLCDTGPPGPSWVFVFPPRVVKGGPLSAVVYTR